MQYLSIGILFEGGKFVDHGVQVDIQMKVRGTNPGTPNWDEKKEFSLNERGISMRTAGGWN